LTVLSPHGRQVRIASPHPRRSPSTGRKCSSESSGKTSCFDITPTPFLLHNSEKYGGFHDCSSENSGVIFEL